MLVSHVSCSILKTIKSVFIFPQVVFLHFSGTVYPRVSKQILNFGPSLCAIFMVINNCFSCSFICFWLFFLQMSHIQLWVLFYLSISHCCLEPAMCFVNILHVFHYWGERGGFLHVKLSLASQPSSLSETHFIFINLKCFFPVLWSSGTRVLRWLWGVWFPKEIFQSSSGLVLSLEMMG